MRVFSSIILMVFCVFAMAPLAWHAISSLKTPAELTSIPPTLLPHDPTVANYQELFTRRPFGRYYANSFVIAALSSLLCLSAASLERLRSRQNQPAPPANRHVEPLDAGVLSAHRAAVPAV